MGANQDGEGARQRRRKHSPAPNENASVTEVAGGPDAPAVVAQSEGRSYGDVGKRFTVRPSLAAHRKSRESPLSSDAIFKQSHAGLFNLCVVVLLAVNSRLIIENLLKYGILIQSGFWFSSKALKDWPLFMCGLSLPVFPFCALVVEKFKVHFPVPEQIVALAHALISCSAVLYPAYVIYKVQSALLFGFVLILLSITTWMKLVSYAHTNYDIRALKKDGLKPDMPAELREVEYPDNITLEDITYFMVAPTLCYQLGYPRSEPLRKGWVLRQSLKLLVFLGLMGFIIEQYINPTVKNSRHPLKANFLNAMERVLKLSIPTLYVWLCMFYCLFHLWLNILAEVTEFGDREFYRDWWNAQTVEEYWRMWNMPVHRWLVRHIYFPCVRLGLSKKIALVVVFAVSGVFHELCVGVPCHMVRGWAFLGILLQVPLVVITNYLHSKFKNAMVGNMVFWFFFCIVGQPMCLLLYYHDVVNQQQAQQLSTAGSTTDYRRLYEGSGPF